MSSMSSMSNSFVILGGVGAGTGASIARRFAKAYSVVLLARNSSSFEPIVKEISAGGGRAVGISTDLTNSTSVRSALDQISQTHSTSALAAAVFNVGGNFFRKSFLDLTENEFTSSYENQLKGGFNFAQGVLPLLLQAEGLQYPPTLIFTGATASLKGSAHSSQFATGKFALRALAQSLAREFGPRGVHVSHAIIDGVIDVPHAKAWTFEQEDAKLDPDAIADSYWYLHTQPRTTFTFEVDLRPYVEKW